ncbi:MAG: hypothetical protein HY801_11690, partial [Candidatus Lindowbacteria bacterium]|nr:hypothetical protein [Candidatus Lindowbacteria bacterium]
LYLRGIINDYVMSFLDGRGDLPPELAKIIVADMVNGLRPEETKNCAEKASENL